MERMFIRVRSGRDILIVASLIILGGVFIALPTSSAVNVTGFLMICSGIILLIFLKTGYKDLQTGKMYFKKERYFQYSQSEEIATAIASKPESVDLSTENMGNSARLDIYFNRTSNKAYIQLYKYVPYAYEPYSDMYEYELEKVNKLIS